MVQKNLNTSGFNNANCTHDFQHVPTCFTTHMRLMRLTNISIALECVHGSKWLWGKEDILSQTGTDKGRSETFLAACNERQNFGTCTESKHDLKS